MAFNAYNDKERPSFWRNVGEGDMITLSNVETMTESQNRGLGFKPMEFQVDQVFILTELNALAEWRAIHLIDTVDSLWLWIKIVDNVVEIKSCWENNPEDYTPGDRQDMADRGWGWLFTEESIVNYENSGNVNDLVFAESIQGRRWTDQSAGQYADFVFDKKGNAEFQCEADMIPAPSGLDTDMVGTVAEYNCPDGDCPDPEMIVFEVGTYEDDEDDAPDRGGLIRILHGSNISMNSIDVLRG